MSTRQMISKSFAVLAGFFVRLVLMAIISQGLSAFVQGQVTPVATPFTGYLSDSVSLPVSSWGLPRGAFRNLATMFSTNGSTFTTLQTVDLGSSGVHTNAKDTFGVMTLAASAASVSFNFKLPVTEFGGYFAAFTIGATPTTIKVQFADAANAAIGTAQNIPYLRSGKDGLLEWHGWHLDRPATTVTLTASGALVIDDLAAKTTLQIKSIVKDGNALKIVFPTAAGVNYSVDSTVALSANIIDWNGIGGVVGTGTEMFITDPLPLVAKRFYRLHAQ